MKIKRMVIITGASGGLGKALVSSLAGETMDMILLVRSRSSLGTFSDFDVERAKQIRFLFADLAKPEESTRLANDLELLLLNEKFDQCFFVNCAGSLSPVGKAGNISNEAIIQNAICNYVSPMLLVNSIIKVIRNKNVSTRIINISSGVAVAPHPEWSVYSSSKAGFLSFLYAVSAENEEKDVKIVSIDPGVMDTKMQELIRSFTSDQFSSVEKFVDYKNCDMLAEPEEVAGLIKRCFFETWSTEKKFIRIAELKREFEC